MSDPRGMDRDVTSSSLRTSRGTTTVSEQAFSRRSFDETLSAKKRTLRCEAKSPLALLFDDTGSMGNGPKIFFDKLPMMAGQIVRQNLLDDCEIALAAVGDITCDRAPIQVCEFSLFKNIDSWITRIWLEGNGGSGSYESYEMMAYFFARHCEMPNAETPFCIIFGDEHFRDTLDSRSIFTQFGDTVQGNLSATTVFDELKAKFKGNVFHVHRPYSRSEDAEIVNEWQAQLGSDKVIILYDELRITDVILGIIAIMNGVMTPEEYYESMRQRKQTQAAIDSARRSLSVLQPPQQKSRDEQEEAAEQKPAKTERQPKSKAKSPAPKKRPKKKVKVDDDDLDEGKL